VPPASWPQPVRCLGRPRVAVTTLKRDHEIVVAKSQRGLNVSADEPGRLALGTQVQRKLRERCTLWMIIAPGSAGRVSAVQRADVVRDRIELSTFRFSEGLLPLEPSGTANCASPSCLHIGWSGLTNPF